MTDVNNILSAKTYFEILDFIYNYKGLSMECEMDLIKHFKDISKHALASILYTERLNKLKSGYHKISFVAKKFLKELDEKDARNNDIVQMFQKINIPPTTLSRFLIFEKYKHLPKHKILDMLKVPSLISNKILEKIVITSILMDNQEGPIVDLIRRSIGEEYEIRLKDLATKAGLIFCDENDLRRTGFDKTPDIKLILPFLYKGEIVNWIESKASFGDPRTHNRYVKEQFCSYNNRFGPGIVIYWFGFVEDIIMESEKNLIILNHFPETKYLDFF